MTDHGIAPGLGGSGDRPVIDEPALRAFLARILGWSAEQAIEQALRTLYLFAVGQAALVVVAMDAADPLPIAEALHRRALGGRPFVVADPRRPRGLPSVRSLPSHATAEAAARAVGRGGTVCVRADRLPLDLHTLAAVARDPDADVRLVVAARAWPLLNRALAILPAPIAIPPLADRAQELPRVIDEYIIDAIDDLEAELLGLNDADRAWVLARSANTLAEIEKSTRRLVAIRASSTLEHAARRLGVTSTSLQAWFHRRRRAL